MRPDTGFGLLVMVLWGLWAFASGKVTRYSGTFGYNYLVCLVMLLGTVIEIPIYRYLYLRTGELNPWNRWAVIWTLVAFFASLTAALVYTYALRHGRYAAVTSIAGAYPIVSVLLMALAGHKMSRVSWLGVLLISVGCYCLNWGEESKL